MFWSSTEVSEIFLVFDVLIFVVLTISRTLIILSKKKERMKNLKLNHLSQARLNVTIFSLSLLDLFFFILHTLLYKCFCFVCSSLSFVRPRYCRFYLACIYLNRKFTFSLFLWIFSSLFIFIYLPRVGAITHRTNRTRSGRSCTKKE